jgi:hypothetical protein
MELHQPMDWLGIYPNINNPGYDQSQPTELQQPMEPNLTYPWIWPIVTNRTLETHALVRHLA